MWQYKTVHLSNVWHDNERELNRMGQEGWELVGAAGGNGGQHVAYFKRPKHRTVVPGDRPGPR